MNKLKFSTVINAPKEKVWSVLFNDGTYRQWASVFAPGSYAETDWKEGSKALFLGEGRSGMVSRIEKNRPYEFLSIRHLGMVKNGIEDTQSDEVKAWGNAIESYELSSAENRDETRLAVEMDSVDEFKDYFEETWPKALDKIKELSES